MQFSISSALIALLAQSQLSSAAVRSNGKPCSLSIVPRNAYTPIAEKLIVSREKARSAQGFTSNFYSASYATNLKIEVVGNKARYHLKLTNNAAMAASVQLAIYKGNDVVNWIGLKVESGQTDDNCVDGGLDVLNNAAYYYAIQVS